MSHRWPSRWPPGPERKRTKAVPTAMPRPPAGIFSFFQQDDTLGSESTADFVLDYTPKQNSLEMEQTANIPDFDTSSMLLNAIDEMLKLRAPLEINKNLIQVVQKIVGKQKQVSNYTDYESGLKSANHFIFN